MLTNRNIVTNVKKIADVMLVNSGEAALSYLPLCHGFERTFTYCYMLKGIEIHYTLNQQTLGESIREVKPHVFTAVPRVLEKFYEKITGSVQKEGWLRRSIFQWSEHLSQQFDFNQKKSKIYKLQIWMADKLVYSMIRRKLGNRIKLIAVGGSACPQKIQKFFCASGIPVREGYGLTETTAVLSVNHIPEAGAMSGTVGIVLPDFEIKIEGDENIYGKGEGEILVRGKSVTKGYYNNPEETAKAFNDEGWLLTGDIGMLVKNETGQEFIKITNRKKELLKSSNGKYIAPMLIENRLNESFLVSQVMVIGDQRKFVSALIVPEFEALEQLCKKNKFELNNIKEIVESPEVKAIYQEIVDEANRHLSHHEQVKKFLLLSQNWSVESDELTPTLKLKRKIIENKYAAGIEQMYETV